MIGKLSTDIEPLTACWDVKKFWGAPKWTRSRADQVAIKIATPVSFPIACTFSGHHLWYPFHHPYFHSFWKEGMPQFETDTLPTTFTDANHPWSRIGGDTSSANDEQSSLKKWRKRVGLVIESHRMHLLILFLVCSCDLCRLAPI